MKEAEAYEFSERVVKYLKNELTAQEERAFLEAVAKDRTKSEILARYRQREHLDKEISYYKSIDMGAAWDKISSRTSNIPAAVERPQHSISMKLKRMMPYAAVLICVLGIGLWTLLSKTDKRIVEDNQYGFKNDVLAGPNVATLKLSNGDEVTLGESAAIIEDGGTSFALSDNRQLSYPRASGADHSGQNEINVSSAGKFKVSLSDGSTVWVSSSSKLRYPVVFSDSERRVSLSGEAYFDIAKDADRPFYVEVGGKTIRVLGTKFNVSAYTKKVRTTLLEGSVRIEDEKGVEVLKPGQQAIFNKIGVTIKPADIQKDLAWKEGYFTFSKDPITNIMDEIARWYEVDVSYKGNISANDVYTGSIPRGTSLGSVLLSLADVSGLKFEIDGRDVQVTSNLANK